MKNANVINSKLIVTKRESVRINTLSRFASLFCRVCLIMFEKRVLCFQASFVKPGYYAQNYARLEV